MSPMSARPPRSGSSDTSVDFGLLAGSRILGLGKDVLGDRLPPSRTAAVFDARPGEPTNSLALPSLSDMLDNRNRADDAVSETYSTGTENQRQAATGFDMMLRTSRASVSSTHFDGSPVSITSPELQASELAPAKDVGMPIKSLLSTNTTDPMYDLPVCAQTSRKLRHVPVSPELASPQRHAPWRMGDMVGLKVGS